MSDLSRSTIPLFSALGALTILMGGMVWLTTIANDAKANTADIAAIQVKQDIYLQKLQKISEDIIEIKTILKIKDTKKEK
jgi:hypothetical protein